MEQDEQATWHKHKHKASSINTARPIKSRKIRWVEHETRQAKASNTQRVLMGKPEGRRRLGRTRRRRNDNISTDLKEIWWEVMYCIKMAQNDDR
jgi:L-lactate utilization protein LutC